MSAPQSDRPEPRSRPTVPRPPGNPPTPRALPRYRVVLVADRGLDLMHVIRSIMELTRFPREESTHKMWQAHHHGRSVLLQTHLERAELYVEQFAGRGVTLLVEPV